MKALVILAHPHLSKSRVNRALVSVANSIDGVTVNELYRLYPDFLIDVPREQKLLVEHDVIVLQHPFYWYSAPALLKEWMDAVLEYGFAYGEKGIHLKGKKFLSVISTGGALEAYRPDGTHFFSMTELLRPFEQTASLCGMNYEPPFLTHGVHHISDDELSAQSSRYRQLLLSYLQGKDEPK